MSLTTQRTTHRVTVKAPADLIFTVLRDSSHWPFMDGLTVYSERVSGDDADHELRTSIVANGALNSSRCHRLFNAAGHRAEFRQIGLEHPLLKLGGSWVILRSDGDSEVTLTHEFEVDGAAAGDLPELMQRMIDDYSRRELEALRLSSERLSLLVQQHSAGAHAGEA